MVPFAPALAGPRNFRLGAEELLELGQAGAPPVAAAPGGGLAARTVSLSKEEAGLVVRVVENIVSFAQGYPVEFQSYCPPDRWQKALTQVGTWSHEIESQLASGAQQVSIPAEAVFRLVDLEKCVSAARDARLSSAKWAFGLAAAGSIANFVFGISWIGVPTYLAGLAILFGRPLIARFSPEPQEPYKPAISGRGPYWVEYVGPRTGGAIRRAGPLGCPYDMVKQAMTDGGIAEKGADGDFILFDVDGRVVEMEPEPRTAA